MVICKNCVASNPDEAKFCSTCGETLVSDVNNDATSLPVNESEVILDDISTKSIEEDKLEQGIDNQELKESDDIPIVEAQEMDENFSANDVEKAKNNPEIIDVVDVLDVDEAFENNNANESTAINQPIIEQNSIKAEEKQETKENQGQSIDQINQNQGQNFNQANQNQGQNFNQANQNQGQNFNQANQNQGQNINQLNQNQGQNFNQANQNQVQNFNQMNQIQGQNINQNNQGNFQGYNGQYNNQYSNYQPPINSGKPLSNSPVVNLLKQSLSSGLFLTTAIMYSCYALLLFLSNLFSSGYNADFIRNFMYKIPELEMFFYYSADFMDQISASMMLFSIISVVPLILTCVSLWLIYSSSKKFENRQTTGLTIIKVLQLISLISLFIVLAIGILFLIFVSTEIFRYYPSDEGAVLLITIIIAVVVCVLALSVPVLHSIAIIKTINAAKSVLVTGNPKKMPTLLLVMNYIVCGFSVFALFSLSFFTVALQITMLILVSTLVSGYNRSLMQMQMQYQNMPNNPNMQNNINNQNNTYN